LRWSCGAIERGVVDWLATAMYLALTRI
jgi:hypothetical protein